MDQSTAQFWRDKLGRLAQSIARPVRLMEVCGTHTHAIARHGIRELLPENVSLISGPGCPVCVSGARFIEKIRVLARQGVTVALFGDLLRIPGDGATLQGEANLKIVYSPLDALKFAMDHPEKTVVFAAVGFAPTLSAGAALLAEAAESGVKNFYLLADFKRLRPVLELLAASRKLDGFLLPGHVASVIGTQGFAGLAVPGVVAGFEAEDVLHAISLLLEALAAGKRDYLYNDYPAAVHDAGNPAALALIHECFAPCAGDWRGLGRIEAGGWAIRKEFASLDAETHFDLSGVTVREAAGCRCGEVLTGDIAPTECPLFGKGCTPEHPVGACMSSLEGACSAFYQYSGEVR